MRSLSIPLVILIWCGLNCTSHHPKPPLNPNGDSELALLMRQMFEDGMVVKEAILEEEQIPIKLKHHKLLTAKSTDPKDSKSEVYQTLANDYLRWVNLVNDPKNPDRRTSYSNLVNSCTQCHKALCPGPLIRIEKMVIE